MTILEDKIRAAVLEAVSLEAIEQRLDDDDNVEARVTNDQNILVELDGREFKIVLAIEEVTP